MDAYAELIQAIALTLGVAWASGISLYAAVAVLGICGGLGVIDLPPTLETVQDPLVIVVACFMYCVEFLADKTPDIDTSWDALHSFIRIPAGAVLAAGAIGDVAPPLVVAAGLVGGMLTAATHATKAGARVMINTSPEPFSNWAASIGEDLALLGGLYLALNHPVIFLASLGLFILLIAWLLPKLMHGVAAVFRKVGRWLGLVAPRVAL